MRTYTKSHEWIEVEGNIATIGITQKAVQEIGEIVHIELPKLGKQVQAGQEAVVLESTKAAVDICSPVSGTIVKVNSDLQGDIHKLNRSPENEGWLFQLRLENEKESANLI